MGSKIYFSNDDADVSGYKKAYIDMMGPNASTTLSSAVTNTAGSGSNIDMTITAGGTVLKFITMPLLSAVAVTGRVVGNIWAKESAAGANAGVQYDLAEYTTSQQSDFTTDAYGTELTTSSAQQQWSGAVDTPTTIDAGNRLVIQPQITNVGTMGASETVTMYYNGSTIGADGESFLELSEVLLVDGSQFGNGAQPLIEGNGPSTMPFGDWVRELDPVVSEMTATPNSMSWSALRDELLAQCGEQAAGDASLQSA